MKKIIAQSAVIIFILPITFLVFALKEAAAESNGFNNGLSQAEPEKPSVFLQLGHSDDVNAVAFSPDGKLALSGSSDKTLKLWDIATGREIRTFEGHSSWIPTVAFSPDGKMALSGGSAVKLWNISTGNEIRTLKEHSSFAHSVAFSPDGKLALSGHADNIIRLWNVASGIEVRVLKGHSNSVHSVVFSPDGKLALSGSWDNTLKLWDITTGKEIRSFNGHKTKVMSVAFSPDGKLALSGVEGKEIKIWDISTGKEIKTFRGHSGSVNSVAFSPDGKLVLSGSSDNTLRLWDISTGEEIRTFKGHSANVDSVSFSPDGKLALSGSGGLWGEAFDNTLRLWDIVTGEQIRSFAGNISPVYFMDVSQDGRLALSGRRGDGTLRLWDIKTGKEIRTVEGHMDEVTSVALSPDGKLVLSGGPDGTIRLWDITTGKEVSTFKGHLREVLSIAFSPDGKMALSGSLDNTLKLWDVKTGKEIRTFKGHSGWVSSVTFSPDGKLALSGSEDNTLKLWDIAAGKEIRTLRGHLFEVGSVAFSPDGKIALSGVRPPTLISKESDLDTTLIQWDLETGKKIRAFHSSTINSVSFSPNGKLSLSGGFYGVTLRDVETGKEIKTFIHQQNVIYASFSPDGKLALSCSIDGTIRLWDIETGEELIKYIDFTNGEWMAFTPEGYYNSSAKGDAHINVRIGNQVHGIDAFRDQFYRPDIVEEAIKLRSVEAAVAKLQKQEDQNINIATLNKIQPPTITVLQPQVNTIISDETITLKYLVEDNNLPIQLVQVYANSYQVQSRNIKRIKNADTTGDSTRVEDQVTFQLEPGDNIIRIVASNGRSTMEESIRVIRETVSQNQRTNRPENNLWVLAIGVSQYDNLPHSSQLAYADDDARAIAAAFKKLEGTLYKKVHVKVISDDSDIQPTGDNIIDNLSFITQAGQYDTAILFIAGHGLRDTRRNFYFLPKDAEFDSNGDLKRSSAVRYSDFMDVMDQPARTLLFTDTCHAEGISGKKTRGIDSDEQVKFFQDTGAVILTSSRGDELSQESAEWGHGLFTYAILEGMKGAADVYKERPITMKELDAYISEMVPRLSGGAQHPITFVPGGYDDFVIYANQ